MANRVGLKEAAKLTNLSVWELRTGCKSGKYPHFRVGGKQGRIIFDVDLLNRHIEKLMMDSLKQDNEPEHGKLRKIM